MIIKNLIQQSKNGNTDACSRLITHYDPIIMKYCLSRTKNNEDWAQEVAQITRIKIFKFIKNFKEECAFTTWAYILVKNSYYDTVRRKHDNMFCKRYDKVMYTEEYKGTIQGITGVNGGHGGQKPCLADKIALSDNNLLNKMILAEEKNNIKQVVNDLFNILPDNSADVLIKYYFQKKAYQTISDELSIPLGTVKSRISRAKKHCLKLITPEDISSIGRN